VILDFGFWILDLSSGVQNKSILPLVIKFIT